MQRTAVQMIGGMISSTLQAGKLEDKLTDIVVGLATISEYESCRWQAERAEWERKRAAEEKEARRVAT